MKSYKNHTRTQSLSLTPLLTTHKVSITQFITWAHPTHWQKHQTCFPLYFYNERDHPNSSTQLCNSFPPRFQFLCSFFLLNILAFSFIFLHISIKIKFLMGQYPSCFILLIYFFLSSALAFSLVSSVQFHSFSKFRINYGIRSALSSSATKSCNMDESCNAPWKHWSKQAAQHQKKWFFFSNFLLLHF